MQRHFYLLYRAYLTIKLKGVDIMPKEEKEFFVPNTLSWNRPVGYPEVNL